MQHNVNENALCPSFNSYSLDNLTEIAYKVTAESNKNTFIEDDDEFEFSVELPAHQINNQGPVFPVFNRQLHHQVNDNNEAASTIKLPLKNLFLEETEASHLSSSSSSSEADELESIPPGTYCVWRPRHDVASSPATCKKSKSTGSASKRFRIRDLIRRSNSEGKAAPPSLVFLTPKKDDKLRSDSGKMTGKLRAPASPSSSAHETFYMQNRAMKEGEKRKSYLPYRKDLVGFFANVNGLGKAAKPFPPY